MRLRRSLPGALGALALILAGCPDNKPTLPGHTGTTEGDPWPTSTGTGTGTTPATGISLFIQSPGDGDVYASGEPVELTARVMDAYNNPADTTIQWSAPGGWTAMSSSLDTATVFDLPPGTYTITASASVGSDSDAASVDITIEEPDPIDYSGTLFMETVTTINGVGDFDYPCDHRSLTWTLVGASFEGQGQCEVDAGIFGSSDFYFDLRGTVSGSSVSGELEVTGGSGEVLPFTGTFDEGSGAVDATYDETFTSDEGSIRLYGSFHGEPI